MIFVHVDVTDNHRVADTYKSYKSGWHRAAKNSDLRP